MSGGVDSSLTAMLLKQDYDVLGVVLKLHDNPLDGFDTQACENMTTLDRAKRAAEEIEIPLHVLECSGVFLNNTLKRCWAAFEQGDTPNPCHICNATVKFPSLLKAAEEFGADKIATGHYARIIFDEKGRAILKRGVDFNKDQSYFLSGLSSEILSRILLPLGGLKKEMVRKLAERHDLSSVKLKESQDLCFAGQEGHFSNALFKKFNGKRIAGVFVDEKGVVLGRHDGIHQYTIGQRRGLGFATGSRVKIISIDPTGGVIVVSDKQEAACNKNCTAAPFQWSLDALQPGDTIMAQVRYRQTPVGAVITHADEQSISINFEEPVFGVTPGQILVLYRDDCVQGSGVITR